MTSQTKVNYITLFSAPSAADFVHLRSKVGWGDLDLVVAKQSLEKSLFHVIIKDNHQVIAMGRVVGDGVMYFYIQDVIVDPEYQQQGLGHKIMLEIEKYLQSTTQQGSTVGLLSAKGKETFYQRFGYICRPNNTLGNGMCKFI